ncbi:hypothetical protein QO010_003392 [Caulobacter ginsengisoli]|uniref:DUF2155 domain-containing protein n=1 Tax=Caulobacter ginsengisoli TaxID=400775 RepID=A0ABU0IUB4_9CAUL|nr:hypothetical protein [Caulobacter ginsengisoli]MDQ0465603.1 hypothetical protein [Caulobacter ginsengisoli]
MTLKIMLAAALLAAGAAPTKAYEPWEGPPLHLKGAIVEAVVPGRVASGVLAVWSRVRVRAADGAAIDLFSLHMDETERLPGLGQVCDFDYHVGRLGGSWGDGLPTDSSWPMIDAFTCGPATT